MKRKLARGLALILVVVSLGLSIGFRELKGYERASDLWGYGIHDLGTAPGGSYSVLYLGALKGHHTVYHGGAVSNGLVGASINLPNRSLAYEPRPSLVNIRTSPATISVLDDEANKVGGIVYGLNTRGMASGTFGDRALFFDGKKAIGLDPLPGFNTSEARSINEEGVVAGFSEMAGSDSHLKQHATLWGKNGAHDLGVPPGCLSSRANSVNNLGQVAISAISTKIRTLSFLWEKGHFTSLGTLGGGACVAEAINDRCEIVGTSEVSKGIFHAFLWRAGVIHDLGVLPGGNTYSKATGVNNRGEVVGWSGVGEGWSSITRPFLWTAQGGLLDLTKLVGYGCPFQPRTAYGISEEGDILVYGYRKGFWHTVHGLAVLRRR